MVPFLNAYEVPRIDDFSRVTYGSFHRIGWAAFVAWIIFTCFHGYGGAYKFSIEKFTITFDKTELTLWSIVKRIHQQNSIVEGFYLSGIITRHSFWIKGEHDGGWNGHEDLVLRRGEESTNISVWCLSGNCGGERERRMKIAGGDWKQMTLEIGEEEKTWGSSGERDNSNCL